MCCKKIGRKCSKIKSISQRRIFRPPSAARRCALTMRQFADGCPIGIRASGGPMTPVCNGLKTSRVVTCAARRHVAGGAAGEVIVWILRRFLINLALAKNHVHCTERKLTKLAYLDVKRKIDEKETRLTTGLGSADNSRISPEDPNRRGRIHALRGRSATLHRRHVRLGPHGFRPFPGAEPGHRPQSSVHRRQLLPGGVGQEAGQRRRSDADGAVCDRLSAKHS